MRGCSLRAKAANPSPTASRFPPSPASGRGLLSTDISRSDLNVETPGGGSRTAPTLDDAPHVAEQIAEGLEYTQERGIIHRDLKPANVKVRPDGMVKVPNCGSAKALE